MRYDKLNSRVERLREKLKIEQARAETAEQENYRIINILNSTMHEVRSLTSELTSQASRLLKMLSNLEFEQQAATVLHTSEMITARLAYTDLQLNPRAISLQTKVPAGLYKKFEKARYVLGQSARDRQISINFQGNSFATLQVLQAFELLPFIVLDNAIKYSPQGGSVDVKFSESSTEIRAEIYSLGPKLKLGEQEKLFEQGYRGSHAQQLAVYGAGLGLYVARNIADLHDGVSILARGLSEEKFMINDVPYAEFHVEILARR